jgi:two-component system LytT family response regulator
MKKLSTIIIDDKWLFREDLKKLLLDYPQLEVVGEGANLSEGVELVNQIKPDVIFLDIQLQKENGFDLLKLAEVKSDIIFITAHDQYAIRAFEVNALDYLLKPINKDRLHMAVLRLLGNNEENSDTENQQKLYHDDVIYLMIDGSLKFVKISRLKLIVAERNYSYIYYGENRKELISKTLHDWEQILPEKYFVRIHRSTIVNFEFVEKVHKCKNYTHEVIIEGINEPFFISRRYATKLKSMTNHVI